MVRKDTGKMKTIHNKLKSSQLYYETRIGIISTRFAGTDGVSLETSKWIEVLNSLGHTCFHFTGLADEAHQTKRVIPEAFFNHPDIQEIYNIAFSNSYRPERITQRIHEIKDYLKQQIIKFINDYDIQLLIAENSLAIPLNIPLGFAITEFIAETNFPTIAHHHDFFWERKRFLTNSIWDYLNMCFPPHLPSIFHVVINTSASNQLSLRTGISSMLIPNVMDFDHPPISDDYANDARAALGIQPDELFFLQPTRVVPRKGIEQSIELISRLGLKAKLVISHASGDEGYDYEQRLREFSNLLHVQTNFVSDIIQDNRGTTPDGRKIYTLWDIYPHADIVTYPSTIEGFGNAFLEAIYYKRPIIVNNYSIFSTDIKPKGFTVIEFDGYLNQNTINQTLNVLNNPELAQGMAEHNYQLGRRFYSYSMLRRQLSTVIAACFGEGKAD
jgi:glycosyltransferase involved in cell wall biosynthesis